MLSTVANYRLRKCVMNGIRALINFSAGVIIVGFLDQEYTFFENGPDLALVQVGRNIDSGPAFRVEMTAAKPSKQKIVSCV